MALRCPFCENTKKATKNPTARPTKGTRRATVPPKPPLKAHMHIVTHQPLLHGALFDGKRSIILANLKNLTEGKVPMGLAAVC